MIKHAANPFLSWGWRLRTVLRGAAIAWVVVAATAAPSLAQAPTEGAHLYNVTMLRAAPGQYAEFMAALEETFELAERAGDDAPFWIRHSQGDQWDFMVIYPMGNFATYYAPGRVQQRAAVWDTAEGVALAQKLTTLTSYREEWFARSVDLAEMTRRFDGMGLFHVEMFTGIAGKREQLYEQRRMENRYYEHLERQQNLLFIGVGGSDWDAMTIGFYESLQAYAAAGVRYTEQQQNEAAIVAGFDGVNSISPYLRSLLSSHHDTLAVPAR